MNAVERVPRRGEPALPWCTGWARYWIERDQGDHTLIVAAQCRIVGVGGVELALFDTGAQWSLVGGELAELARPHSDPLGPRIEFRTRLGTFHGELRRLTIDLLADEGSDLRISASVLFLPNWPGPSVVLGYRGLLEWIRFGFDPGCSDSDQWFCFGGSHAE